MAFIVLGEAFIVVGGVAGFGPVRNFAFRLTHLVLIGFVAIQTLLGQICPLTNLEHYLRVRAAEQTYSESFVRHWIGPLIFIDAPEWAFIVLHCAFALAVIGTWWLVPPVWPQRIPTDNR